MYPKETGETSNLYLFLMSKFSHYFLNVSYFTNESIEGKGS